MNNITADFCILRRKRAKMRIIVDGMGGDHAPLQILKGCEQAVRELGVQITVTGPEPALREVMRSEGIDPSGIDIADAPDVISMEDDPLSVVKDKKNSSMGLALRMLSGGEGDALVSAGNSGALLAGGTLVLRRIKGVKRAAFAPVMPTAEGHVMIIDSGATVDCRPEFMAQYGVMGSAYMKRIFGLQSPRVGLANNGSEECKGTQLYVEAHKLLKADGRINFVGNVEGRGIMLGDCDVLVADGFTGNLILKTLEGMGSFLIRELKGMFYANLLTKLAALMLSSRLKPFKKKADYKEIGGAVLLGLTAPVIKAHGSSDARALKNAVRQAAAMARADITADIARAMAPSEEA